MRLISKTGKNILQLMKNRTWISVQDIQALFYPNLKYARRVMVELIKNKYIKEVQSSLFECQKGPGQKFYAITTLGNSLISLERNFKEPKQPTSTSLLHYTTINTMLSGFEWLRKKHDGFIVESLSSRQLFEGNKFHQYYLSKTPAAFHDLFALPDFILCLGSSDNRNLYIGEVDTGTENISSNSYAIKSIIRKFKSFSILKEYAVHDYFSDIFEYDFSGFIYLHITTSEIRLGAIKTICDKYSSFGIDEILLNTIPNILGKSRKSTIEFDYLLHDNWTRVLAEERSSILL